MKETFTVEIRGVSWKEYQELKNKFLPSFIHIIGEGFKEGMNENKAE